MAKVEDWFGLAGVAWLSGLQILALAATLYLVSRRWGSRLRGVAPGDDRPERVVPEPRRCGRQVLSYLLVVLTLGAWLRTRDDGRLRWWLIPLTWLWAMVHGMWPIGIGLGVLALVGMALDRDLPRRDLVRGLAIPALSAVAAACTPVGPELYVQLVRVQERARFFSEWGRPDPVSFSWIVLAVLLVVAVVALLRTRPVRRLDAILVALCVLCSVWSWRTVPVSALLLVPTIAVLSGRRAPLPSRAAAPPRARAGRRASASWRSPLWPSWCPRTPPTSLRRSRPGSTPRSLSLPAGTKVPRRVGLGRLPDVALPRSWTCSCTGTATRSPIDELQRNTDITARSPPGWDRGCSAETGCTARGAAAHGTRVRPLSPPVCTGRSCTARTGSSSCRHRPAGRRCPASCDAQPGCPTW